MPYLLVRHKVSDFTAWKAAYDAHLAAREDAGLKEEHLLRNAWTVAFLYRFDFRQPRYLAEDRNILLDSHPLFEHTGNCARRLFCR
jgi:hypothetical protein